MRRAISETAITHHQYHWGSLIRVEYGSHYTLILHPPEQQALADFIMCDTESLTIKVETGDVFNVTFDNATESLVLDGGDAGTYRIVNFMELLG